MTEQQKPKRPRTEDQRRASRANGAKSRGPRSTEAKQRTKRNALTHGAHSNEVLLPNEDEAQYEALRTAVLCEYNPQTALEADMAEQIFTALWKRRRYQAMQQALWKQSMHGALEEKQKEGQPQTNPESLPATLHATEHLLNEAARWCHRNGDSYAQLDALENRARLAFARAQRNWRQYKKDTQQDKASEEAQEQLAAQLLDAISIADFANQTQPDKAA